MSAKTIDQAITALQKGDLKQATALFDKIRKKITNQESNFIDLRAYEEFINRDMNRDFLHMSLVESHHITK